MLKVLESYAKDIGRGVARIDCDSMSALGASTGDVIEIKGKRRTVAGCLPLHPSDEGKGIIKIDHLVRNNSGTCIGDAVSIRRIKGTPVKEIVVVLLKGKPFIDVRHLADAWEGMAVAEGDKVMVPYFFKSKTFQVVRCKPPAYAAIVARETLIRIARDDERVANRLWFRPP